MRFADITDNFVYSRNKGNIMEDFNDIDAIGPFKTDAEAVDAFQHIAASPVLPKISKYFYLDKEGDYLKEQLLQMKSIDDFQYVIMSRIVKRILETTAHNFSYDGIANVEDGRKFLMLSNHRDIILDPAILQWVLYQNNLQPTEICVGDNLIQNKFIEYLIRSNRMIKVIRGVSARELYLSSQRLSRYIRKSITTGESSVWLAQRQGRTKDGYDTTEQGLLKMLDMSGRPGCFKENFEELNIVPMSISYEIEPCDILKAREMFITKRDGKYVKGKGEDLNSILVGVTQQKGNIHLNIGTPLTSEELSLASLCDKNDRYQYIRHAVNIRVVDGYRLWKNNYIAYDMLNEGGRFAGKYSEEDKNRFAAYMEHQLDTIEPELDRVGVREYFLKIYANPIVTKDIRAKGGLLV